MCGKLRTRSTELSHLDLLRLVIVWIDALLFLESRLILDLIAVLEDPSRPRLSALTKIKRDVLLVHLLPVHPFFTPFGELIIDLLDLLGGKRDYGFAVTVPAE